MLVRLRLGFLSALCIGMLWGSHIYSDELVTKALEHAPAPADNPLKGLVPYQGDWGKNFPHSMEFNYLAFSELVVGEDQYDWSPLERLLDDVASRGHQAIFRVYLEYPAKTDVIPKFLLDGGLKVHRYVNTNTQPLPPSKVETPDYEDPNLRRAMRQYIAALGAKYDGDPRIAYITAGLLGTWGEWHTYPREELFASKATQREVLDAYAAAFKSTPVLLRYPAGADHEQHERNDNRPFGYHDDSFAWATLNTGKRDDSWFYMPTLKAAGATDKWKTQPIGGEIRPEAWGKVFDEKPGDKQIQNFETCVRETHATWLMDSGMFEKKQPKKRIERAIAQVRRMGYELHVSSTTIASSEGKPIDVAATVENRGVAPFYHPWKIEFALLSPDKELVAVTPSNHSPQGLLPGSTTEWKQTIPTDKLPAGKYRVLLRSANPLPNGNPLGFANKSQNADREGWLTLGVVEIR